MTDTESTESTENAESNSYDLSITTLGNANVPMSALEGLRNLLAGLIPVAEIPHIEHLAGILVIEDGHMTETMREIEQQDVAYDSSHQAMPSSASAVALAIVTNDGLRCFVILEERVIRSLTPEDYLQMDALTTVLEELLHVRHDSGLADQLIAVRERSRDMLDSICFKCLTEYMAIRWKAEIITPEFADKPGAYLIYGEALGPKLDNAGERIIALVTGIAAKSIPFASGNQEFMEVILRGIFEPLTRERAYRDGDRSGRETPVLPPDASQSWFYVQHVAGYWEAIYDDLRQAFDAFNTNPQETVVLLADMKEVLMEFLLHVGVEYTPQDDGQAYLMFHSAPALAIKATKPKKQA